MTTAAVRRLSIPSPDELIERARVMAPEIRALAEETERNRNLFPHIVEKIRGAELLRTCRPKEFGGFEYDGERYRSLTEIARRITGAHWSGPRFFGLRKAAAQPGAKHE